jgi:hypothetical protein
VERVGLRLQLRNGAGPGQEGRDAGLPRPRHTRYRTDNVRQTDTRDGRETALDLLSAICDNLYPAKLPAGITSILVLVVIDS